MEGKKIQREHDQFNLEQTKYEGQANYLICLALSFVPPPPLSHLPPPMRCSSKMNCTGAAVASTQPFVTIPRLNLSNRSSYAKHKMNLHRNRKLVRRMHKANNRSYFKPADGNKYSLSHPWAK